MFLHANLTPKCLQHNAKLTPKPLKNPIKNLCFFFNRFSNGFLMDLEVADPVSDSPPPTFSCNTPFPPSDVFLLTIQPTIEPKSFPKPSKNHQKINTKVEAVFYRFLTSKCSLVDYMLEPERLPKRLKNSSEN